MRLNHFIGARICRRWALPALLVFALAPVPAAQAHHIAGATYRGSLPNGGSLEFDVAADGSAVTRIKVSGKGDVCEGTLEGTGLNIPIVNHTFNHPNADPISFSGSFPSKQAAQGTLAIDFDLGPPIGHCRAGPMSWTATTGAPLAGSQECRDAMGAVNAAQVQANSTQTAAASAQDFVNRAGAAVAAARRKVKNLHKRLRSTSTSTGKKKLRKQLKLASKRLSKARSALAAANAQLQTATGQQQDAATQLQTATGQQQAEC
jgi:hypothetical protein